VEFSDHGGPKKTKFGGYVGQLSALSTHILIFTPLHALHATRSSHEKAVCLFVRLSVHLSNA